ncbi:MAG: hypothetical protein WCA08_15065 [Desulfoferrobacter sp.]
MKNMFDGSIGFFECLPRYMEQLSELNLKIMQAACDKVMATQTYWKGVLKYTDDFATPFGTAVNSFSGTEKERLFAVPPLDNLQGYLELFLFNLQLAINGFTSSLEIMNDYHLPKISEANEAWLNTLFGRDGEDITEYTARQLQMLDVVVNSYPKAIKDIEPEYGFHFDNGGYVKAAETDRFELYQVLPLDKSVQVREDGKPIIIVPPYVLGANILAFLPGENRSYTHCYANQGIPTYIRILKDIDTTPAVQVMTGEDDARDTRVFCEQLKAKHGKPVTVNGFCQGGLVMVMAILSGELDGLVDAFITCASPMDGTRSKSLVGYLKDVPDRFQDMAYATKTLPNGNQVVDGKLMSWVYKIKSIDQEAPIPVFYRDLKMFDRPGNKELKISKTAAAINYWLLYERQDLPVAITQLSYDSYTIPVTEDGTLPVKLFGRKLNFKRIEEMGIKWLICYAEQDELVEKEAALAPLDYIHAEVTAFPKGHASIATSWSIPTSQCALHTCFNNSRGPVCFQMELDQELQAHNPANLEPSVTPVQQDSQGE